MSRCLAFEAAGSNAHASIKHVSVFMNLLPVASTTGGRVGFAQYDPNDVREMISFWIAGPRSQKNAE